MPFGILSFYCTHSLGRESPHLSLTYLSSVFTCMVSRPYNNTAKAATSSTLTTSAENFNSAATPYEKYNGGCTLEFARQLLDLPHNYSLISGDSIVLGNACGPGIVAEEVRQQTRTLESTTSSQTSLFQKIYAVDPAPNMVYLAKGKTGKFGRRDGRGCRHSWREAVFCR